MTTAQTIWQCFRCGSVQVTGGKCADEFDPRSECATSPYCAATHPLAPGFVPCTKPRHAPEVAHGCGDEPGCAAWFDGETEWRYLPYESEEQWRRLHELEGKETPT